MQQESIGGVDTLILTPTWRDSCTGTQGRTRGREGTLGVCQKADGELTPAAARSRYVNNVRKLEDYSIVRAWAAGPQSPPGVRHTHTHTAGRSRTEVAQAVPCSDWFSHWRRATVLTPSCHKVRLSVSASARKLQDFLIIHRQVRREILKKCV